MVEKEELIKALKCSLQPKCCDCTGCRYRGLDEWDEKIPCKADVEIDGVKYWEYCDTEQMARDSIMLLEKEDE